MRLRRFFYTFWPAENVVICRHREVEKSCPTCCAEKAAERLIQNLKSSLGLGHDQ